VFAQGEADDDEEGGGGYGERDLGFELLKEEKMPMGECLVRERTRVCLQNDGNLVVKTANKRTLDSKWKKMAGSGTDIDADTHGTALIRTKHGKMFKYTD